VYGAFTTCGVDGFAGTSASAPGVAGAAALLLQHSPGLTPAQLQARIESLGVDLGTAGKDNTYGSGREALPSLAVNTVLPSITGPAATGSLLTASPGTWSGSPTLTYQFERCNAAGASCVNIGSPTPTSTYLPVSPTDTGGTIRVKVAATTSGLSTT